MPSLTSFIDSLKDGLVVRAAVPLAGNSERERLSCFFRKNNTPEFCLIFPHGSLAVEQVDPTQPCLVMIDALDETTSISSEITQILDQQTLKLTGKELANHPQGRRFFRVDSSTRVAASSLIPQELAKPGENWKLLGDTIDLSGSGLLCTFSEALPEGQQVRIELSLPTQNIDVIQALGHVVRCRKIDEELYQVALDFDTIDPDSQDRIMACCFEIQRRFLRMRVEVQKREALL